MPVASATETRRTSGWSIGFDDRRNAATIATASTTNAFCENGETTPASDTTPSRNETRKAASDVSPRGRSRRTSSA